MLTIQIFTNHIQIQKLLHLIKIKQTKYNITSIHQKIYIIQ